MNALGDKVGAALMRPHRSYLAPVRKLIQAEVVSGFAHITAGGLTENLPRILPRGLAAQVDLASWETPPLFTHLQTLGDVEPEEMLRTFNMGIGMVLVVSKSSAAAVIKLLEKEGETVYRLGTLVKRAKEAVIVRD